GYILKKTESCLRQATKYKYKLNAELKVRSGYYKELAVTGAELDDVIGKAVEAFFTERNRTVVTVDHRNLARIREEARGTQEALIVPDADAAPDVPGRPTPAAAEAEAAPEVPGCPTPANADDDPWAALKNALTGTERKALSLILNGNGNLRTLADENGLMLEVLIDSINEKATDHIGDNIIDMSEEIAIYDEYKGYITL
ncbi:MAG: hypothetical protein FWG32_01620, partial [Oscillospiraceae bacterium]|nr:hypothetical protein [Oscillospiraceae bacterium]